MKRLLICILALSCLTTTPVQAQSKRPIRDRLKVREIDREDAQALLAKFRNQRIRGDFCFRFKLSHLPRRGESTHYHGRLWGSWNEYGPVTRLHLLKEKGPSESNDPLLDILLQSGSQQKAWRLDESGESYALTETELLKPLLPNILYAPFHLLMPFIYWNDWEYAGAQRIKGRPAHLFLMFPPESYTQTKIDIKAVRIALDGKFNALLEADILNAEGREVTSFRILNVKKVQGQWIPRNIDLVDSATRNKTRFEVTAAALDLALPSGTFSPKGMKKPLPKLASYPFDSFH